MPRKKADVAVEPAQVETVEKASAEKPVAKKKESLLEKVAPKKTAAKKDDPKKPVEPVEEVYLQVGGSEWNISDCRKRVSDAYVAEGHRVSSIKKLVIYLKPEEGKAYYVINDGVNGCIDL